MKIRTPRKHQREAMAFLKDEYGATNIRLVPGGRHQKLIFLHKGKEYTYIIGSPGDHHTEKNMKQFLKRLLEQPRSA